MINIRYKLINPHQIVEDFVDETVLEDEVVVRPKYLSICKADQRYYQGTRDKKVLNKKLPLTLIHEAVGEVVYSKCPEFPSGTTVVMLPNIQNPDSENKKTLKENYDINSKFRGSSCDGFMQENVVCKKNNILKINNTEVTSVLLELMSVVFNALEEFNKIDKKKIDAIVVYGDGSLSYITSLILKNIYANSKIIVIGKHKEKLDYFTFVDQIYTIDKIPDTLKFDHAFECVGGIGSELAINQIIDRINPQGIINLLGVSEYSVAINTRLVLEKGLLLIGNSRSSYQDFNNAVNFMNNYPESINYLNNIISDIIEVKSIKDIDRAFMVDTTNQFKTIIKWDI